MVDLALGFDPSRVHADRPDAVIHALRSQRPRKRHERRVAARARDVVGPVALAGDADHVDDHAGASLAHALIDLPREVDESEYLQVPRVPPRLVIDLRETAAWNGACIVHQYVHAAASLSQRDDIVRLAEIERMHENFRFVLPHYRVAGRLESGFVACSDVHAGAFGREAMRAGEPNPLRRSGNQYFLAAKVQIHDFPSLVTLLGVCVVLSLSGEERAAACATAKPVRESSWLNTTVRKREA